MKKFTPRKGFVIGFLALLVVAGIIFLIHFLHVKKAGHEQYSYFLCAEASDTEYTNNWASSCANWTAQEKQRYNDCLSEDQMLGGNLGRGFCDSTYLDRNSGSDCQLPKSLGQPLLDKLHEDHETCLKNYPLAKEVPGI